MITFTFTPSLVNLREVSQMKEMSQTDGRTRMTTDSKLASGGVIFMFPYSPSVGGGGHSTCTLREILPEQVWAR